MAKEAKKGLSGIWKIYQKSGDKLQSRNKSCPKCGQGVFMAKHNDRWTCGSCHMTEFLGR